MSNTQLRCSPIGHLLQDRGPANTQREAGLSDLSLLHKMGVKGPSAAAWLGGQKVDVPANIYESRSLSDGGIIVRLGADEFLLESGNSAELVPALAAKLGPGQSGAYLVHREEATFLLTGPRALEVMAQTCGVNFQAAAPRRLVYTRIAGVSCGVLPSVVQELPAYRLWLDSSYAVYLWETLAEICMELGGSVIGADNIITQ